MYLIYEIGFSIQLYCLLQKLFRIDPSLKKPLANEGLHEKKSPLLVKIVI